MGIYLDGHVTRGRDKQVQHLQRLWVCSFFNPFSDLEYHSIQPLNHNHVTTTMYSPCPLLHVNHQCLPKLWMVLLLHQMCNTHMHMHWFFELPVALAAPASSLGCLGSSKVVLDIKQRRSTSWSQTCIWVEI